MSALFSFYHHNFGRPPLCWDNFDSIGPLYGNVRTIKWESIVSDDYRRIHGETVVLFNNAGYLKSVESKTIDETTGKEEYSKVEYYYFRDRIVGIEKINGEYILSKVVIYLNPIDKQFTRFEFHDRYNDTELAILSTGTYTYNDNSIVVNLKFRERGDTSISDGSFPYNRKTYRNYCVDINEKGQRIDSKHEKFEYVGNKIYVKRGSTPTYYYSSIFTCDSRKNWVDYTIFEVNKDDSKLVCHETRSYTYYSQYEIDPNPKDFPFRQTAVFEDPIKPKPTPRPKPAPQPPKPPQNEEGCYIATCVYGSYDCPEVWTLRRFRDYTLAETWFGRAFIKLYYSTSPTLVKWFGETDWFKNIFRRPLDKLVANLKAKGVADTIYHDKSW